MAYLTATITDATKGPFSLATLFAGGTITGVTLTPNAPAKAPRIAEQCVVQADPGNGTDLVYVGTDATMLPAAGGGIGCSLGSSSAPLVLTKVPLTGVWVSANTNNAKVNIIVNGGFE